jgi:hypothetical protein
MLPSGAPVVTFVATPEQVRCCSDARAMPFPTGSP